MAVQPRCSGWCRRAQHTYSLHLPTLPCTPHSRVCTRSPSPHLSDHFSNTHTVLHPRTTLYTHHTAAHALSLSERSLLLIHTLSDTLYTHSDTFFTHKTHSLTYIPTPLYTHSTQFYTPTPTLSQTPLHKHTHTSFYTLHASTHTTLTQTCCRR